MGLGHEKLDVLRLAIGYVAWVYNVRDESATHCVREIDSDFDTDTDGKEGEP